MDPRLSPADLADVLRKGVEAYQKHFGEPPALRSEALESELPYLPLDIQVPIAEAIRWAGYATFRKAVLAAGGER